MGRPALRVVDDDWLAWRAADRQHEAGALQFGRHPFEDPTIWQDLADEYLFSCIGSLFATMAKCGGRIMTSKNNTKKRGRQRTSVQQQALLELLATDEMTTRQIALHFGFDLSRASQILKPLIADGRVSRRKPGKGYGYLYHRTRAAAPTPVVEPAATNGAAEPTTWQHKIAFLAQWEGFKDEAVFVDELLRVYRENR